MWHGLCMLPGDLTQTRPGSSPSVPRWVVRPCSQMPGVYVRRAVSSRLSVGRRLMGTWHLSPLPFHTDERFTVPLFQAKLWRPCIVSLRRCHRLPAPAYLGRARRGGTRSPLWIPGRHIATWAADWPRPPRLGIFGAPLFISCNFLCLPSSPSFHPLDLDERVRLGELLSRYRDCAGAAETGSDAKLYSAAANGCAEPPSEGSSRLFSRQNEREEKTGLRRSSPSWVTLRRGPSGLAPAVWRCWRTHTYISSTSRPERDVRSGRCATDL